MSDVNATAVTAVFSFVFCGHPFGECVDGMDLSKVREHREMETRVKTLRTETKDLVKEYNKTEDDLKALQVRVFCVCMCVCDDASVVADGIEAKPFRIRKSIGKSEVIGREKLDVE